MDRKLAALGTWKRILLVADENTWPVAGATLEKVLAGGWTLGKAILPGDGKADEAAVAAVLGAAAAPDLVLAAGAGTLTDVVRHVAAGKWGIPFVSVPTAPSMDGYASAVSAMTFGGFKVTRPARPPLAIYADLAVLAAAPRRLVAAGAADLLGKHTALTDWLLAREMTDEYHCPRIAALVQEAADACGNDCAALRAGKEDAIARLAAGLIVSGIGILMAGSSRPASGSEHHLSHFWEMKAQLEGATARLHGEKVAAGTVLAAQAYQFLLRQDPGELRFRPRWRTRGLGREQYRRVASWRSRTAPWRRRFPS
jgi:glycerol-1-phosphate dehydrogenase [NAD(P)+]